jgi:anaphase-promoting complex subunit 10
MNMLLQYYGWVVRLLSNHLRWIVNKRNHDEEEGEDEEDDQTEDADDGDDTTRDDQRRRRRRSSRRSSSSPRDDPDHPNGAPHRPPRDYRHLRLKSTPTLPLLAVPELASTVREIGRTASWTLSTAKPGNGVDQLRDSSLDTYWQSDGLQPHHINIQFHRRQTVSAIALYMDFNLDESYTPKRMKVRVGTTFHNLEDVRTVDLREPCGWVTIPLWRKWGEDVLDTILDPELAEVEDDVGDRRKTHVPPWKRKPMRAHLVQISILSMHQNGRDTHVRQVKIFGPRDYGNGSGGGIVVGHRGFHFGGRTNGKGAMNGEMMTSGTLSVPAFQTVGMSQFSVIR